MKFTKVKCLLSATALLVFLNGCSNYFKPANGEILIDNKNINYLIKPQYDWCTVNVDNIILTHKTIDNADKLGFITTDGVTITDTIYDETCFSDGNTSYSGFSEGLAPVKKNGRWGYIDMTGKTIIDFKYEDARLFKEGLACVKVNNLFGYINKKGEVVVGHLYEWCSEFHDGVAVAKQNGKYGFINKEGKWIKSPEFDSVDFGIHDEYWPSNDFLQISKGELKGIVKIKDEKVNTIVEPKYVKIFPYHNGEAHFIFHQKSPEREEGIIRWEGFIDETGKEILTWSNNSIDDTGLAYREISEGLRLFRNINSKWGLIDKHLNEIIKCQFEAVNPFEQGLAVVKKGGKSGVIDKTGKFVLNSVYEEILINKTGESAIVTEGGVKYLVKIGTSERISEKYDDIAIESEKCHIIKKNGKFGVIDASGKEFIAPQFEECLNFPSWGEYNWIKIGNKFSFVNKDRLQKFQGDFEDVMFREELSAVKKDGKWGIINLKGKLIIPFDFDEVLIYSKELVRVKINGKYGFVKVNSRTYLLN